MFSNQKEREKSVRNSFFFCCYFETRVTEKRCTCNVKEQKRAPQPKQDELQWPEGEKKTTAKQQQLKIEHEKLFSLAFSFFYFCKFVSFVWCVFHCCGVRLFLSRISTEHCNTTSRTTVACKLWKMRVAAASRTSSPPSRLNRSSSAKMLHKTCY